jgi:hypothetical protein
VSDRPGLGALAGMFLFAGTAALWGEWAIALAWISAFALVALLRKLVGDVVDLP